MIASEATPPVLQEQANGGRNFQFRREAGLPALRSDLKITQVSFRRRPGWVVKDPVSLQYYRWGAREHRLAMLLDGKRNLPQIAEEMQRTFPDGKFDEDNLQSILRLFLVAGLLQTSAGTAQELHNNSRRSKEERRRKTRWLSLAGKIISFKITLFDPDLLLLRMSRGLSFLWSRGALLVLLAMMAGSAWLLFSDAGQLTERMPDILSWENLLILWLTMIAVKVVHEFGHGLSCKHYGGEVHEMGAMFILFSPFLFCNASDSWTFRDKRHRLVVTFGGIYLELFLAGAAAALWVLTPPGLFNQICFNVMLVCSVMTIFFNANPLMKFDGYYALSDLIEIPNLKERGDKALVARLAGLLTGGEGIPRDPLVESAKATVLTYAVASYAWTFAIAYNILRAMGAMLEPYGLDRLAQTVAGLVLLVGIVTPPLMVGRHLGNLLKQGDSPNLRRRILRRGLIGAAGFAVLLALPWPVHVRTACAIEAANRVRVTAAVDGYLRTVAVKDGQKVSASETMATAENPLMEAQLAALEARVRAAQAEYDAASAAGNQAELGSLRSLAAQLESALGKMRNDKEQLVLRSPVSGTVVGRDLALLRGQLLRRGDLFCEILPEGPLEVVVAIDERDAAKISTGQAAEFRMKSVTGATFRGRVLSVDATPTQEFPHEALGEHAGGTVPSTLVSGAAQGAPTRAIPTGMIYAARVAIENPDGTLRPGMSGRLRIDCGKKPLGAIAWDYLTSMIRTDFRL